MFRNRKGVLEDVYKEMEKSRSACVVCSYGVVSGSMWQ